ncbi:MAG TPA: hypothetical protein VGY55_14740 [Pirellulales bacterium]|jgi:hypothetical protein|nr:hypothetical protein [Pirellulales bacterium]
MAAQHRLPLLPAVADNADMLMPSQFSMRRMLGAVALLGVAMRLGVLFLATRFDPGIYPVLLFLGFFATGGAAVGCIEGKPFQGAFFGVLLGMFIGFIYVEFPPEPPFRE